MFLRISREKIIKLSTHSIDITDQDDDTRKSKKYSKPLSIGNNEYYFDYPKDFLTRRFYYATLL